MQVAKMTLKQCQSIIENNYLGKYKKTGKQVDYSDYIFDIQMRKNHLEAKKFQTAIDKVANHIEETLIPNLTPQIKFVSINKPLYKRYKTTDVTAIQWLAVTLAIVISTGLLTTLTHLLHAIK